MYCFFFFLLTTSSSSSSSSELLLSSILLNDRPKLRLRGDVVVEVVEKQCSSVHRRLAGAPEYQSAAVGTSSGVALVVVSVEEDGCWPLARVAPTSGSMIEKVQRINRLQSSGGVFGRGGEWDEWKIEHASTRS